ncbi:MAG: sulfurtransferase complex subunit TusD [Ketobacteraceae bacterium]|nr:sulfurtransferase complex subunit TusD [Ketobacteraceae bacterium]
MNFALHIFAPPHSSQSHLSALCFAEAVIRSEHQLSRVFFSGDAVQVANRFTVPPQGEENLLQRWANVAEHGNTELILCVSASLQRGLIDQTEADRYEKNGFSVEPPFVISGLGQLVESCIEADRLVTFGC